MGLVIAKQAVYLEPQYGGYHGEGDTFEYSGPDNEHLEAIDQNEYHGYGLGELRDELTRRNMSIPPNATQRQMSELLVGDDNTSGRDPLEPKKIVKAGKPAGDGTLSAPYTDANPDALKAEIKRRELKADKDSTDAQLRDILLADDKKKSEPIQRVEVVSTKK